MLKRYRVVKPDRTEVIVAPDKPTAIKRLLSCDVHEFRLIEDGQHLPKLFQMQELSNREKGKL